MVSTPFGIATSDTREGIDLVERVAVHPPGTLVWSLVPMARFASIGAWFAPLSVATRPAVPLLQVASLDHLMATKVKVILQRSESKDYRDIATMLRAGVRLETGSRRRRRCSIQPSRPPKP